MTLEQREAGKQQIEHLLTMASLVMDDAESVSKKNDLSFTEEIKTLKALINQSIENIKDLEIK